MSHWDAVKHLPALLVAAIRDVAEGGLGPKAADYAVMLEMGNAATGEGHDVRDLAADRYLTLLQVPRRMRTDEMREEMSMARAVMSGYHLSEQAGEDRGQKEATE